MPGDYNPTDLREQERIREEAAELARLAREQEVNDLKWLMSSERGRRIVWRWISESKPFDMSYDLTQPNATTQMVFAEGKRHFGNRLLKEVMNVCPEQFRGMHREQTDGKRDGIGNNSK